jgi:DNA (cytosine-5)-methyltransferase 3A
MTKENKKKMSEIFGFEPILINSSLVTAQQRKRIYFVGKRQQDGSYAKVDIQQPEDRNIMLQDILETGLSYQDKAHVLTASYAGAVFWNSIQKNQRTMIAEPILNGQANLFINEAQDNYIIAPVLYNPYNQKTLKYKSGTLSTCSQNQTAISGQVVFEPLASQPIRLGHYNKGGQGDRIYSVKGKSVCLSANGGGRGSCTGLYKIDLPDGDYRIRKLTVNECCSLQGFPQDYCKSISSTQSYKAIGNSFTVPVIEHIIKHLDFTN